MEQTVSVKDISDIPREEYDHEPEEPHVAHTDRAYIEAEKRKENRSLHYIKQMAAGRAGKNLSPADVRTMKSRGL